jgi:hypothetical protein
VHLPSALANATDTQFCLRILNPSLLLESLKRSFDQVRIGIDDGSFGRSKAMLDEERATAYAPESNGALQPRQELSLGVIEVEQIGDSQKLR